MDNGKITCMIADDNEIDRLTTLSFAKRYSFLDIAGTFESAGELLDAAGNNPPDVLFLDIDIPEMTGLQLRKQLMEIPTCIFITSYPDYAVDSFEVAALDFLVKPVKAERFALAMQRLQEYHTLRHKAELLDCTLGADTVFIKEGHDQIKLQLHDIIYLEALKDYTGIITNKRKYCVLKPLGSFLQEKMFSSFVRIHRSYAVQKNFISKVTAKEVVINNISLPVGRSYKDALASLNS